MSCHVPKKGICCNRILRHISNKKLCFERDLENPTKNVCFVPNSYIILTEKKRFLSRSLKSRDQTRVSFETMSFNFVLESLNKQCVINYNGKEYFWKESILYICITESLCCAAEINAIISQLSFNKNFKIKN